MEQQLHQHSTFLHRVEQHACTDPGRRTLPGLSFLELSAGCNQHNQALPDFVNHGHLSHWAMGTAIVPNRNSEIAFGLPKQLLQRLLWTPSLTMHTAFEWKWYNATLEVWDQHGPWTAGCNMTPSPTIASVLRKCAASCSVSQRVYVALAHTYQCIQVPREGRSRHTSLFCVRATRTSPAVLSHFRLHQVLWKTILFHFMPEITLQ